jgi:hypothetical protein
MKTFNITAIKPNLPFKIAHQNVTFPSVRMFLSSEYNYKIDYDIYLETYGINLQRDFVWSEFQKQQFVLSILKGINIPQVAAVIYSPDDKTDVYMIVDGKQRFSALFDFVANKFPIPCENELFYFDELPTDVKNFLLRFEFQGQAAYSYPDKKISDAGLIQWFRLLNFAGTEQEKEHIELLKSKL